MKIRWHKRAAAQLHQVEEYVLRDFGELPRIQKYDIPRDIRRKDASFFL